MPATSARLHSDPFTLRRYRRYVKLFQLRGDGAVVVIVIESESELLVPRVSILVSETRAFRRSRWQGSSSAVHADCTLQDVVAFPSITVVYSITTSSRCSCQFTVVLMPPKCGTYNMKRLEHKMCLSLKTPH